MCPDCGWTIEGLETDNGIISQEHKEKPEVFIPILQPVHGATIASILMTRQEILRRSKMPVDRRRRNTICASELPILSESEIEAAKEYTRKFGIFQTQESPE